MNRMTVLKTWWFRERAFTNFGDELGPAILQALGHTVERVDLEDADILTTGSILQRLNKHPVKPGTIIWGTGWHQSRLHPYDTIPDLGLDVRAVRGTTTALKLGVTHDVPLGDPGLLASYFWAGERKQHRVGFVRHYIDTRPPIPGAIEIDARGDVETVCRQIGSCQTIVSSSLHGCIVAASYGIPYMRLYDPNVVGGDTKWIDFTTSLNRPIHDIQQRLLESIGDL